MTANIPEISVGPIVHHILKGWNLVHISPSNDFDHSLNMFSLIHSDLFLDRYHLVDLGTTGSKLTVNNSYNALLELYQN